MTVLEIAVMYPLVIYWLDGGQGVEMVAWATVIASVVTLPAGVGLVSRALCLSRFELFKVMWRPLLATVAMVFVVILVKHVLPASDSLLSALWLMLVSVSSGAVSYVLAIFCAWYFAGKPQGLETRLLNHPKVREFVRSSWLNSR